MILALDVQILEDVLAEQNSVAGLHIQKFNGKDIVGIFDFVQGKEQRRRVALLDKPRDCLFRFRQKLYGNFSQHAEDIQIRELLMKVSTGSGAIQEESHQILAVSTLQFSC